MHSHSQQSNAHFYDNAFVSLSPTDKLSFNFAHTEGNYYRDSYTVKNGVETGAGTAYYYKDRRENAWLCVSTNELFLELNSATILFTSCV